MNSRRSFLRQLTAGGGVLAAATTPALRSAEPSAADPSSRSYWLRMLQKVAEPVVNSLADGRLREHMPVKFAPGQVESRRQVTHLEAVGRTLAGIAPWLELTASGDVEEDLRQRWAARARKGLANIVDPESPDHLNFTAGSQCLVDAAFLAHALLRAPRELWAKLNHGVQEHIVEAMQSTRKIKPGNNNWLLFSAMVEAFLASAGAEWQADPIEHAIQSHEQWYRGDGAYGDGPEFHWDYYNSYVIQPFLIDVLETMAKVTDRWAARTPEVLRRARRYAAVQERLIAPDGSYPILGRSIAYRCGAFQLLAHMALRDQLPDGVAPGQVRAALAAVIRRTLEPTDTFDANGWLRIGLAGHQPGLGEGYISTGSLYLCTFVFLPLGLSATHPFWSLPATDWTSRKVWSGQDLSADHALKSS